MKWIDFDKLEEEGKESTLNENEEELDIHFLDEFMDREEDVDDEEYLALPKDSFLAHSSEEYDEEEYLNFSKEASGSDSAQDEHRRKREEMLFHIRKEQKDIYEMPEEEAKSITMEERRSHIGRTLGLSAAGDRRKKEEQEKKPPLKKEEAQLQIPDHYFEDMADRMADEMRKEEKKEKEEEQEARAGQELEAEQEPLKEYDPMAFGDVDQGYEEFREKYRNEVLAKADGEKKSTSWLLIDEQKEEVFSKKQEPEEEKIKPADMEEELPELQIQPADMNEDLPEIQTQLADIEEDLPEIQTQPADMDEDLPEIQTQPADMNEDLPEVQTQPADMEENPEGVFEDEPDTELEELEESAFVEEDKFRQIEIAERKKQLGIMEDENEEKLEEEETFAAEAVEEPQKSEEEETFAAEAVEETPKPGEEETFAAEAVEEFQKPGEETEENPEGQLAEEIKEEPAKEAPKAPKALEVSKASETLETPEVQETPKALEASKASKALKVPKEEPPIASKQQQPAKAPDTKIRPVAPRVKELANENQENTENVGTLKKRALPKRQLGLDRMNTLKNEKVVKAAQKLEKELQDSKVEKKEKSKKIDKLHSAFEEEFENAAVDDLLVRQSAASRKKAKKRKGTVAWEEDDTPDHPFREFIMLILAIAAVVFITFVFVEFIGQRTEVSGSSMERTLHDKDNLIVDKITYVFQEPERFDIIVFPYVNASGEEVYFIKRIIGLPGETVRIDNGFIYINGKKLKESYGKDNELILHAGRAANDVKLGEDEYFVLGDNRNDSADSREIGNIKRDQIVGRAWIRIWPLNSFGILKHQ